MRPESWRRIEDLYHRALAVDASGRAAFLAETCADDVHLRHEVESLLAHDKAAETFIESPALEVAGKLLATRLTATAEVTIGPYRLLQQLGEGGMGEVWLAEQSYPVRRRVALKLIKAGMDTREVVTRFESERQALALMDHPAVAKVFDGGSTSLGRPYFVMEYVPGVPITEWCDQHKLSVAERLELFIHVCEGVQHAHQKAIIHRDLKPSNILVTEVDGKAAPKIIDFGVAKAVSQGLTEETLFTRVGVILGTPEYMSPEQADSAGEDIDTRTDVYSLGVILYQLLVGTAPLDLRRLTFEEMLRKLREDDPPRPSTKLRTLGDQASVVVGNRRTAPKSLERQLRGDLDSIVLKALEKQRVRRYAAPSELAADIGRYLRHEAVMARPASAGYQARKYVRRHRLGVAFAAAVILLLASFAVTQAIQLRRTERERDRADRVTGFMTGMFKVSDPSEARGKSITAREILDKASNDINSGLVRDPELRAQLMEVMSTVYLNLGLYSPAESLIRQTVQIRRRVLGPDHRDTLRSNVDLGITLFDEARYAESGKLLKQTVESTRRVAGPDHPDTIRAEVNLGITLFEEGRYGEAEKLLRHTVESSKRVLGPENIDTLKCMNNLALTLREQHRYAEEEALSRQTLEIARRTLGPDHPLTLNFMLNLTVVLDDEGRYAEEEPIVLQSLEIERRVLGSDHPQTLKSMNNLANLLIHLGRNDDAAEQLMKLRDIERRTLGPNNPTTAISTYNLACIAVHKGDNSAALSLLHEALDHGLSKMDAAAIKDDPDFQPLYSDPRFAVLLTYAQKRATDRASAQ